MHNRRRLFDFIRSKPWIFFVVILIGVSARDLEAQERAAANTVEAALSEHAIPSEQIEKLVGQTASVLLADGTELKDSTLSAFTTRRRDDRVSIFRLEHKGKKRKYPAAKVYSFKIDDRTYKVNYLPSAKAAAIVDVQKRRAVVSVPVSYTHLTLPTKRIV